MLKHVHVDSSSPPALNVTGPEFQHILQICTNAGMKVKLSYTIPKHNV